MRTIAIIMTIALMLSLVLSACSESSPAGKDIKDSNKDTTDSQTSQDSLGIPSSVSDDVTQDIDTSATDNIGNDLSSIQDY